MSRSRRMWLYRVMLLCAMLVSAGQSVLAFPAHRTSQLGLRNAITRPVYEQGTVVAVQSEDELTTEIDLRLTPFEYFVPQGNGDDSQATNCGPASLAMALRYASADGIQLTPEFVRDFLMLAGNKKYTSRDDVETALNSLEADYQEVMGAAGVWEAIKRHHTVVVPVMMSKVSRGEDLRLATNGQCANEQKPFQYRDEVYCYTRGEDVVTGRYYSYSRGHFVLANGIHEDADGSKYFYIYDPNVWVGNAKYYYLGETQLPKGQYRLWTYDDLDDALAANGNKAVEVMHNPANSLPGDIWTSMAAIAASADRASLQQADESESIALVEHINYPNGAQLTPGDMVLKSWRIQNVGNADIGQRYEVLQTGGVPVQLYPGSETDAILQGQSDVVSVYVQVPDQPGNYTTEWRVVDSFGESIGGTLSFNFTVNGSSAHALDAASYLLDVTIPDGAPVSPGTSTVKTWRVRNTGSTTWTDAYHLVFVGGDQLSAPTEVSLPATAPNATADLSVNITAPSAPGTYRGNWRLQNAQGTYFGDSLYVEITVPGANDPPVEDDKPAIKLTCLDCPASVPPGTTFRPTIRATVNSGALLESRGDMLRHSGGELYGAYELIAATGAIYTGQTHDFTFYAADPLTAPGTPGTYETQWRVWRAGAWSGDPLTIRFTVGSGSTNHAPAAPTLTGPGDWAVYKGSSGINLSASANGDPDGDAVTAYYFEIFESAQNANSGWISADHWSPQGLGFNNYQWHAKVRDSAGNESGWSETWHFTVLDDKLAIHTFYSINCGTIGGDSEKVCFCADTDGGTLKLQINHAADGSTTGVWEGIDQLGVPDYNCGSIDDNPPNLDPLPYASGTHVVRLYARGEGGWENAAHKDITLSLPSNRKPNAPHIVQPAHDAYLPSRTVRFDWDPTLRTTGYRLQVSLDDDRQNLLLDKTFSSGVTEYTHTFSQDYDYLYLRVIATGPYGTNRADSHFHIDRTPPSSSISVLPATKTDTKFAVNWGGSDARSGLRWYHLQVRQEDRSDSVWEDWLVDTAATAAMFQAQPGHRYCFRVRAMDDIGNWEAWPSGDGDTCTVIDPAQTDTSTWWNADYTHKRNLVVLNNDSHTMPAGFPVRVHFDGSTSPTAAQIYNALTDPSGGKDLRIVTNDTTELDRYVQRLSSTGIDIWFPLQAGLGGTRSADGVYQLYYGKDAGSLTTPPHDVNAVFEPKVESDTRGLWHFFEGSGSTVADTSGRNHNGTFNSAAWADGYLGYTGQFNGSNAYVNVGNSSDFNVTAMTIEAWIYLTGSPHDYPHVISKWGNGNNAYFLRIMGDGTVQFQTTADGGNRSVGSGIKVEQNRWYHVAGVHDGNKDMWVYVNGEESGHNGDSRTPNTTSEPLKIGRDPDWSGTAFPGYIQHVRISNTARRSFPYAKVDVAPSVEAGLTVDRPVAGDADLALVSLTAYPSAQGGQILQAVVENRGTRATGNEFYTDLYADHVPTGAADYTGSVRFWVNASIAAGERVTLTTTVDDPGILSLARATLEVSDATPWGEASTTFYAQADSAGRIAEPDDGNNISSGTEVCVAGADGYEDDDTRSAASWLQNGVAQQHNFDSLTDEDWFKFTAQAAVTYTLATADLASSADTYLYLYDRDGTTLLSANDDFGNELSSEIAWVAETTGTYYVLVKHWNPNVSGCSTGYTVYLTDADSPRPGDPSALSVFLPALMKNYTPPPPTYTFRATAAETDVEIARLDCDTWSECRNATSSNYLLRDYARGSVTSDYDDDLYNVKRWLLDFDTSQLPPDAQITDATLHFYVVNYGLAGATRVHVVQGYQSIPVTYSDLDAIGAVSAGSAVAALDSWTEIPLSGVGRGWVVPGGCTKLAVIHDLDYTNTAPTEPNGLVVAMAESDEAPYLEVRYTLPATH